MMKEIRDISYGRGVVPVSIKVRNKSSLRLSSPPRREAKATPPYLVKKKDMLLC
jgi:hypothetical protein